MPVSGILDVGCLLLFLIEQARCLVNQQAMSLTGFRLVEDSGTAGRRAGRCAKYYTSGLECSTASSNLIAARKSFLVWRMKVMLGGVAKMSGN